MKATKIFLSVTLCWLIGCTAVTATEEPADTAVPPTPAAFEETPMNEEAIPPTEPASEPTPTDDGKQVSEPVTVDLGEVTPVPMNETPVVQPAPGNPGLKEPVVAAMNDLSQRLGVAVADIEMVSLQEVTWRDGSAGCPEEGVAYTQALVSGQQLILKVDGQEYHYHSSRGSEFSYCSDPVPPLENVPTNPLQPIPGQDD